MEANHTLQMWLDEKEAISIRLAPTGVASHETIRGTTGLAFIHGIGTGGMPPPPIAELMGFTPISGAPGHAVFQGLPGVMHYNPGGAVHGGYAATLLDLAVGGAIHTMLPAGKIYTTLELKINYVRAMTDKTGPVRAEGKVISCGGQIGVAEGRITDASGKLYAYATTTCLIYNL